MSAGEKVPTLPQRLLGRDLFWWLTRPRFMRVNTATRLGRRLRARGEFVIGTNRRRLRRAGVRFRPRLVTAQGQTAGFADGASLEFVSRLVGDESRTERTVATDLHGGRRSISEHRTYRRAAPVDVLRRLPDNEAVLVYGSLLED